MTPGQQVKGNLIHSIHEYSLEIYHKLGIAGVLGIQEMTKMRRVVLEEHTVRRGQLVNKEPDSEVPDAI